MRIQLSVMIVLGIIVSVGCHGIWMDEGAFPETPPLSTIQPDSATREIPTPDRFNPSSTDLPERIPPPELVPSVTGEVPEELLGTIMADLAKRTGITSDRFLITRAQAITWNDGSLGCPLPDALYTQMPVNGYWVVLQVDGTKYDYRVSESGYFFPCENGFPPISPPSTPDS